MKKLSKRLRSLLALLLTAAMLSACSLSGSLGSSIFESEVRQGNYEDALEIYTGTIAGDTAKESEARQFLLEYLEEALDSYVSGEISADEFASAYDTLYFLNDSLGIITSSLSEAKKTYQTVFSSRSSYEAGIQYLEDGEYENAITSLSQVDETDTADYSDAQTKLQVAQEQYIVQIVTQANDLISDGDYASAISLVKDAKSVVGDADEFEAVLGTAYTGDVESTVAEYIAQGEYAKAIEAYDSAKSSSYVTISADLTTTIESAKSSYRAQVVEQATQSYNSGDISGAIDILEDGLDVLSGDETLTSQLTSIEDAYRTEVLSQAAQAYASGGVDSAVSVLTSALSVLPGDDTLNDEISYYRSLTPVKLSSLTAYETDGSLHSKTEQEDCFGNSHEDILYNYSSSCSYTYRIDGQYSTLSGTLFINETSTDYRKALTIYGDGVQLYTYTASGASDPVEFSVNLTGVKDLTIEIIYVSSRTTLYLSECVLTPVSNR